MQEKLKSFWITVWDLTLFVQNTHFSWLNWLASKFPKWMTKIPWTRFWKNSLSLFHDWDFYSPVTCERLWLNSRLGLPLMKESRKWVAKSEKPRYLKIFLSVFHYWKSHSPEGRESKPVAKSIELSFCMKIEENKRESYPKTHLDFFIKLKKKNWIEILTRAFERSC